MSVRYGVRLRKKSENAKRKQKLSYVCPKCGKTRVRRIDFAQWQCKSCGVLFAGGAYEPTTGAGMSSSKALSEKA